jgi:hypothetical protein
MFWRFLIRTRALSLVPLMAKSVRILFSSHDRCWSVGSRASIQLLCHLATCAPASMVLGLRRLREACAIPTGGVSCAAARRCIHEAPSLGARARQRNALQSSPLIPPSREKSQFGLAKARTRAGAGAAAGGRGATAAHAVACCTAWLTTSLYTARHASKSSSEALTHGHGFTAARAWAQRASSISPSLPRLARPCSASPRQAALHPAHNCPP